MLLAYSAWPWSVRPIVDGNREGFRSGCLIGRTAGFVTRARLTFGRKTPERENVSMNLKPLGDRVVVEREAAKDTTAGGIVLPDTARDKPQKGKVLAVGEGRITKDGKRRELQVKVGDTVLFTSYAPEEIKLQGGDKVLLMREDDILAVLEG
jgi:chaperonin GroES